MGYQGNIPVYRMIKDMKVGEEGYAHYDSFVVDDSGTVMLVRQGYFHSHPNVHEGFVVYIKKTGAAIGDFSVKMLDGFGVYPQDPDYISSMVRMGYEFAVLDTPTEFSKILAQTQEEDVSRSDTKQSLINTLNTMNKKKSEVRRPAGLLPDPNRVESVYPTTADLREMLALALLEDDFTYAAELRDQINATSEPLEKDWLDRFKRLQ